MPSYLRHRLPALGVLGALLIVTGCFEDEDGSNPPIGPEPPDLAPGTALGALDQVIDAIAEAYYLNADGTPVIAGDGDTTTVDNALLVWASGDRVDSDLASATFGQNINAAWQFVFVDSTLTVREEGYVGPAKYVAAVDRYAQIEVERDPWHTDEDEEINGGVIDALIDWNVDTDAAIDSVWSDSQSNASQVMARIDSLISSSYYVIPGEVTYPPVFDGIYPADQVDSVDVGGEWMFRVSSYRDGVEDVTDYPVASHVWNREVTPTSTADFTIVFWADTTQLEHGLFAAGDTIQGHLGQVIKTGTGVSATNDVALYRVVESEDDTSDVYWVDVGTDLVAGEVTGACEPCDAPNLRAAAEVLVITSLINQGGTLEVTSHDPADVWYVDRDDSNDRYAFVSDPSAIPNNALDFFEIDEVVVGDTTHVDVDPADLGVDLDDLSVVAMLDLGNFADGGSTSLQWRVDTRFQDDQANELVIFGDVIDYVEASEPAE